MGWLHRIYRIAGVLVASQLRTGRTGSDPNSFFGRGISLVVYNIVGFLLAYGAVVSILRSPGAAVFLDPVAATALVLPLVPAIALGAVLVAGVLFELSNSPRFSSSDSINWLPVLPEEYVLASALAIAYSYSITLALTLGASLALALAAGAFVPFLLAALLGAVGLLLGGLLLEMLRAVSQHAASALGGRSGRFTLFARAAAILAVGILFVFLFNPLLFLALLRSAGTLDAVSTYLPFLWSSRALSAAIAGAWGEVGLFAVGQLAVVFLIGYAAAELRARYWYPTPSEIRLSAHVFGRRHAVLAFLGFRPEEAAVVSKDLRGLVRRREMVPLLIVPIVFGLFGVLGLESQGTGGLGVFTTTVWVAWISGFFGLLLATTSIGQERRAFQNLYAAPLSAGNLFRAKAGSVGLLAGAYAVVTTALMAARFGFGPELAIGLAIVALTAVFEGTVLGLAFATRYSDFQDRPRPQYLRPSAMLGAMGLGFLLLFGTIAPLAFWLTTPGYGAGSLPLLVAGIGLAVVVLGAGGMSARTGMEQLFREIPF